MRYMRGRRRLFAFQPELLRTMEQTVEQPTVDAFDAAVTSESNYVEKPAANDATIEEPQRATDGTFKSDEAEKVDAKPADDKRPSNAEARKDPNARIRQQAWDQREAERRAEAAERRAEDAERRARELETARREPERRVETKQAQPQAERFPDYAAYLQSNPDASLEEWLDARDEWRDTRSQERTKEQAETQRIESTFQQKVATFSERLSAQAEGDPEFEKRVDQRLLVVRPYSLMTKQDKADLRSIQNKQERDTVAFRCFLADRWIKSEHPKALLEHLSKPQTFQRLATLPPDEVVEELANFEADLRAASRKDSGSARRPSASQANAPIKPLGTSPHGADSDDGSDDEPVDTFIRRENAKDRKAGRL